MWEDMQMYRTETEYKRGQCVRLAYDWDPFGDLGNHGDAHMGFINTDNFITS